MASAGVKGLKLVTHWCVCGGGGGRFEVDAGGLAAANVMIRVGSNVNSSSLDRETINQLDVLVVASDARNHSSTAVLTVRLIDINDRRPVFATTESYVADIDENSLTFSRPVIVKVTDSDYLSFQLTGTTASLVTVHCDVH